MFYLDSDLKKNNNYNNKSAKLLKKIHQTDNSPTRKSGMSKKKKKCVSIVLRRGSSQERTSTGARTPSAHTHGPSALRQTLGQLNAPQPFFFFFKLLHILQIHVEGGEKC